MQQIIVKQICGYNGNTIECFDIKESYDKRNFMHSYLKSISKEDKLKQVNQLVPQYTKLKMQIKESENKGLGIFLDQGVLPLMTLFKINLRKTISSFQINQKMFLQSTLYRYHKKIKLKKISFKNLKSQNDLLELLVMKNLLYHFGRIKDSLLKEEIVAYPTQDHTIVHDITESDLSLFKYNIQTQHEEIEMRMRHTIFKYHLFKKTFEQHFSQEQFSYYFGCDIISIDEYKYLSYLVNTRAHNFHQVHLIVPILNFCNQAMDVISNEYSISTLYFHNKVYILMDRNSNIQSSNQEFLINYQYDSLEKYAFNSGFAPRIKKLQCLNVTMADQHIAEQYQVNSTVCLERDKFEIYTIFYFLQLDKLKIQLCLKGSTQKFKLELKQTLEQSDQYIKIWKYCKNEEKNKINTQNNYFDIWANVKQQILTIKNQIQIHLQEIQNYLNDKLKKNQNSQVAQLIFDYQTNYYNHLIEVEQQLNLYESD